jgi:hypothetical protein
MKDIGKNSNPKRNRIQETLTKEKIKKSIEKTGFLEYTTRMDDKIHKLEKVKNKIELIIIKILRL